jgi:hypothetical protein
MARTLGAAEAECTGGNHCYQREQNGNSRNLGNDSNHINVRNQRNDNVTNFKSFMICTRIVCKPSLRPGSSDNDTDR